MTRILRCRFWLEINVTIITGILLVFTIVWHDWIEILFNIDPDQDSGFLEWLVVGSLLIFTGVFSVLSWYEWNRSHVITT